MFLMLPRSINSHEEIIGLAVNPQSGDFHAFLATPINPPAGEAASPNGQNRTILEDLRKLVQHRLRLGRVWRPARRPEITSEGAGGDGQAARPRHN